MAYGWALKRAATAFAAGLALAVAPASAQVRTVDPNTVIDADLDQPAPPPATPAPSSGAAWTTEGLATDETATSPDSGTAAPADPSATASAAIAAAPTAPTGTTYQRDDLIGAAEGVFGRGAESVARMIEDILRDQGEPNGYIVGREAGGAFVFGLRYGSGTLHHRVEGQRPVYWTGPSLGLDAGANAGSTFVLVYNLHDSEELFERFPAGEGAAYLIGGFNASYLRRGDVVLIPIRAGVGARVGVNVGYMKFSRRQRWLPF
jgi:hypothetical protein